MIRIFFRLSLLQVKRDCSKGGMLITRFNRSILPVVSNQVRSIAKRYRGSAEDVTINDVSYSPVQGNIRVFRRESV